MSKEGSMDVGYVYHPGIGSYLVCMTRIRATWVQTQLKHVHTNEVAVEL